jgi:hypothetical protein
MTVTQVESSDKLDTGGGRFVSAGTEKQFVLVEVVFENLSDQKAIISKYWVTFKDSQGSLYRATGSTNAPVGSAKQPALNSVPLWLKGTKTRVWLTFEVPKTAKGLVFEYQTTTGSGNDQLNLQVNLNLNN